MWRYLSVPLAALVMWIVIDAVERGVPSGDLIVVAMVATFVTLTAWRGIAAADALHAEAEEEDRRRWGV